MRMCLNHDYDEVWLAGFISHGVSDEDGNPRSPLGMSALELHTGQVIQFGRSELQGMGKAPFPVGQNTLFVAYHADAALGCFIALGWSLPVNVLDVFTEFRWHTNGRHVPCGNGLIGALAYFGLSIGRTDDGLFNGERELTGLGQSVEGNTSATVHNGAEVLALARLLTAMQNHIDWPRALLRGQYACAVAAIERNGVPIDTETFFRLRANWSRIRQQLISVIDAEFRVYDGFTFRSSKFSDYLERNRLEWPRHQNGELDLKGLSADCPAL
jgi:DNA polymerase-1